jgi:glycogen debranching enzyme
MEERDTTMAEATGTVAALFLACPPLPIGVDRPSLLRLAKAGVEERRRVMEGMLADAYLRVSDERLTHAAAWARLTLDALMVRGEDTLIVSGLPWDGAWSGRDNAQALSGLTSLSGSGPETAAIIRALGRRQDTVKSHRTYGRIADRFGAGWSRFEGADVAPSLIRGMYEAVAVTNDTALVRECWPLLRRSVAGIRNGAVDSSNFLLHDPGQTWMTGVDRGRCAAELQLLWHFEQIIGSYVASFIGDTLAAAGLRASGIRTIEEFNKRFVDTTTFTVFDHLDEHGRGVHRSGPNALMCLEAVGQTLTLRNVVRSAAESLFHPCGVASLAAGARGYVPGPDADGRHAYDGAVWTWLTGPAVYGLTRFDAQDVAFRLTQNHAGRMLGRGVVGALPEMITVRPNDAEEGGEDAGRACSATGLAEFSRVLIQDYLGIRIDASAGELMVQPKLPPGVTTADLRVRVSGEPVDVRYDARTMPARVVVGRHGGDSPLHVRVIWLLSSGDAWRGRVDVLPDQEVTLVIGEEEMFAQEGSTRVPVVNPAKIRGFSQRADLGDVRLVGP